MNRSPRRIVVAIRDETNGRVAMRRALTLAKQPADAIHLVHVERTVDLSRVVELLKQRGRDSTDEAPRSDEDWLERLAGEARAEGRQVECVIRSGRAGTVVPEYAREVDADLIVVASPRKSLARELFLGSSAMRILRTARCPVLVARNDPAQPYGRALVAVDTDATASRVIAATAAFFSETQIDLAHAYLVPEEYKLRLRGVPEDIISDLRRSRRPDIEQDLQPLASRLPQAVLHLEHGFAPSVILELYHHLKPDIIVVGKHSGSALDEQVMGSVTQFLLYACNTDFLLVA